MVQKDLGLNHATSTAPVGTFWVANNGKPDSNESNDFKKKKKSIGISGDLRKEE